MHMRMVGLSVATSAIAASALGFAAPAAADNEWVMPDVQGMVLQSAIAAVEGATGGADLDISFAPRHVNQVVYNMANWTVCNTHPDKDEAISQDSRQVIFAIVRLNDKC